MTSFAKLFVMSYDGICAAEFNIIGETQKAYKVENTGYDMPEHKGCCGWLPKSGIDIGEISDGIAYAEPKKWFMRKMDWSTRRLLNLAGA